MPEIIISVRGKIAQPADKTEIIGGNGDYTVSFRFDQEWQAYPAKTARFVWRDSVLQKILYADVLFEGDSVTMPPVSNTDQVCIGVYAGDVITSTPARLPCYECITDGEPSHDAPSEDVYLQIIDYMEELILRRHSVIPSRIALLTSFPDIAPPESLPECIDTPVTVVGETDAMQYTWAQGDIDGTTGQDLNTQDFWWERRIREPDYIPIPPAAGIVRALPLVDGTNESAPKLYFYDSSKNFISCTGFQNYGDSLNIPANARFLRIVVGKYMVGSTIPLIVPADLSACEIEFRLGGS